MSTTFNFNSNLKATSVLSLRTQEFLKERAFFAFTLKKLKNSRSRKKLINGGIFRTDLS